MYERRKLKMLNYRTRPAIDTRLKENNILKDITCQLTYLMKSLITN
jgi:hypothetical protein